MANRKGKELRKRVERVLREEGAHTFVASTTGTSHQCLDFIVEGLPGHFAFASTPRGPRETLNACAAARRVIRRILERAEAHSEEELDHA